MCAWRGGFSGPWIRPWAAALRSSLVGQHRRRKLRALQETRATCLQSRVIAHQGLINVSAVCLDSPLQSELILLHTATHPEGARLVGCVSETDSRLDASGTHAHAQCAFSLEQTEVP